MEGIFTEIIRRNKQQTLLITVGMVLITLSVYKYTGLVKALQFAIGTGLIFGMFEALFIRKQLTQGSKGMGNNRKAGMAIYLVLATGMILAVTAFIGVFDFVTNLMFGVGLGIIVAAIDTLRRKS
ncbi:hypothetical protein ACFP56_15815 [Paenibacillus septentrionalis]|uniref:Uncharacterized protein n=1 Tax=Paenibacillus septentrionalis TaxID=429342 RepID=A0ABW1V637_9BACL